MRAYSSYSKVCRRILLVVSLLVSLSCMEGVFAAAAPSAISSGASAAVSGTPQQGWVTDKAGRKRYYVRGKYKTGLYRSKNGNYYLFTSKGYLRTGTVTYKKATWYIPYSGRILGYKKSGKYYLPSGKLMNSVQRTNCQTMARALAILKKVTKTSMTQEERILAAFTYVMGLTKVNTAYDVSSPTWIARNANFHFVNHGGTCIADACAFAYLAKALGCKNIYVCVASKTYGYHAWCEIDGMVYDPYFAYYYERTEGFYRISYASYATPYVIHQQL